MHQKYSISEWPDSQKSDRRYLLSQQFPSVGFCNYNHSFPKFSSNACLDDTKLHHSYPPLKYLKMVILI